MDLFLMVIFLSVCNSITGANEGKDKNKQTRRLQTLQQYRTKVLQGRNNDCHLSCPTSNKSTETYFYVKLTYEVQIISYFNKTSQFGVVYDAGLSLSAVFDTKTNRVAVFSTVTGFGVYSINPSVDFQKILQGTISLEHALKALTSKAIHFNLSALQTVSDEIKTLINGLKEIIHDFDISSGFAYIKTTLGYLWNEFSKIILGVTPRNNTTEQNINQLESHIKNNYPGTGIDVIFSSLMNNKMSTILNSTDIKNLKNPSDFANILLKLPNRNLNLFFNIIFNASDNNPEQFFKWFASPEAFQKLVGKIPFLSPLLQGDLLNLPTNLFKMAVSNDIFNGLVQTSATFGSEITKNLQKALESSFPIGGNFMGAGLGMVNALNQGFADAIGKIHDDFKEKGTTESNNKSDRANHHHLQSRRQHGHN